VAPAPRKIDAALGAAAARADTEQSGSKDGRIRSEQTPPVPPSSDASKRGIAAPQGMRPSTTDPSAPLFSPSLMGKARPVVAPIAPVAPVAPTGPHATAPAPGTDRRRRAARDAVGPPKAAPVEVAPAEADEPVAVQYVAQGDGFYAEIDGGRWRLMDRIDILASVSDEDGGSFGYLVRYGARHGEAEFFLPNTVCLTVKKLAGFLAERRIRVERDAVLHETPDGRRTTRHGLILRWLDHLRPALHRARVKTAGWHPTEEGHAFVLPNGRTFGPPSVIFDEPSTHPRWAARGTLREWQENVARFAEGNSRMVLCLCTALAGPLIELADVFLNGGFNLFGGSSTGKTTCLMAAGSVWGLGSNAGQVRGLNATPLGIERAARESNGTVLIMDELKRSMPPQDIAAVIYNVANTDARATANSPDQQQWRCLVLFTSEYTVPGLLGPRLTTPGLEPRMADIPAEVRDGTAFEDTHGVGRPGDFADMVQKNSATFYGTAGPRWADIIARMMNADRAALKYRLDGHMAAFTAKHLPRAADNIVVRVAQRMALLAASGEIAIEEGVLPWRPGAAAAGVAACFRAWLKHRAGTMGAAGYAGGPEAVREYIRRFPHRFTEMDDTNLPADHAGWIERDAKGNVLHHLVRADVWPRVLGRNLNPRTTGRRMLAMGLLKPSGEDGRLAFKLEKAPANHVKGYPKDRPRVYAVVTGKLFKTEE
jgi:hypothetical protein